MVKYICNGCDKLFTHKGSYNRHKNKKNPCIPPIIPNINIVKRDDNLDQKPTITQNYTINLMINTLIKPCAETISEPVDVDIMPIAPVITNIIDIQKPKCQHCDKIFSKSCHLSRHYKTCSQKQILEKKHSDEIILLKHQNELLLRELNIKTIEINLSNAKHAEYIKDTTEKIQYLKTQVSDAYSVIKLL